MKKIITLLSVLLLFVTISYAQEKVESIKKRYNKLDNSLDNYSKKEFKDVFTDGVVEATGVHNMAMANAIKYYKGNEVQKVVITYLGQYSDLVSEYYYREGELFFVKSSKKSYEKDKSSDDFDKMEYKLVVNNYYFSNKKMIKWEGKTSNNDVSSEEFKLASSNYLNDGAKMITID